jgi:hypothetical protein
VTLWPWSRSAMVVERPAMPAPTTMIFRGIVLAGKILE